MIVLESLLIGIAFGSVLERAGLADCRKLAAQFYLTDMTVFKVMFTAIVSTMLALFWMGHFGLIDPLTVQPLTTYLLPQFIGGILFGVGFIVGGYCPGTSCAAAAVGRGDAFAFLGGMTAGIALFYSSGEEVLQWTRSGAMAALRIDHVMNTSQGWTIGLVTTIAVLGFWAAEAIERRKAAAT